MDIQAVLAKFDQEQRREITYPGMRKEETDHVIRMIPDHMNEGLIVYSNLPEQGCKKIIQNEIGYFSRLGMNFEWKAYGHDHPKGLNQLLAEMGFEVDAPDSVMVLNLQDENPMMQSEIVPGIRRLTSPGEVKQVLTVQQQVWDEELPGVISHLQLQMEQYPQLISIFAAYDGDTPVSSAWITYHENSQFAGLWGGSTLPDFRNRGYYSSLLKVRINEAISRGVQFATVDASPMSRPILEHFGFQCITHAWRCVWRVTKN